MAEQIPFKIAVEPDEVPAYKKFGLERLFVLPENGKGLVYSRNCIKDYSRQQGDAFHWQFDDDIEYLSRVFRGYRIRCDTAVALRMIEDFVDRYENVAIASINSEFFIPCNGSAQTLVPPFYLNGRCYTCFLIRNDLPNRWRFKYNEDTDMSLQVLADGWCTLLFNAILMKTKTTMMQGGGQTPIYTNDGRLNMANQLKRLWPRTVTLTRKFKHPQHKVAYNWRKFDTPLRLKPGLKLEDFKKNDYGLKLVKVAEVKSGALCDLFKKDGHKKGRR